ncbi:MAG: hypothetical protein HFF23_03830 [Oscillospiraceae bacterium]|jgi:beta-lactamase regulating signal transducer with metallopeptidase domain|nr:hypothetical protein [Oscillospiraceae bacterium]
MTVDLFFAVIRLSVVGSTGYILLKLLAAVSGNRLSQSWRYHGIVAVSLLFVLPVYKLWEFIPVPYSVSPPVISFGGGVEPAFLPGSPAGVDMLTPQPLPTAGIDWGTVLERAAVLWLWVAVSLVLWNVWRLLRYRRLIEQAGNKVNSRLQQIAEEEARLAGIGGEIRLLASPLAQSPMLVGFFCPTILLPSEHLPDGNARFILAHELTHFRRKDLWKKLLFLMVRCAHWFNPIVYLLNRDFSRWLETSCDEQVVSSLDRDQRKEYGRLLIDCAPASRYAGPKLYVSLASCRYKLKRRISIMLNSDKKSRSLLGLVLAVALVVGCLATTALAASVDNDNGTDDFALSALSFRVEQNDIIKAYKCEDTGMVTVVDTSDAEQVTEYTSTLDLSTAVRMDLVSDASDVKTISWDVPFGAKAAATKACSMEAGEKINVTVAISPASSDVQVGIVDSNGAFRYVLAASGSVNHDFSITAHGVYYVCVVNGSSNDVSVAGFVNC